MKKSLLTIPALALVAVIGLSQTASATDAKAGINVTAAPVAVSAKAQADMKLRMGDDENRNAIFGTVTAVSSTTITIASTDSGKTGAPVTVYTVNTATAVVDKDTKASTAAAIVVGDHVMVQGTVTGNTIVATKIHNGVMAKGVNGNKDGMKNILEGNGQPIVGGTVTAVNGNTVTITNKSNIAYTIDVTNAKVTKNGTASTSSTIAVGDTVLVQGAINGTAVTAVSVTASNSGNANMHVGFFAKIGNFFARLFGKK
ncbi:MAG: DUF5666 domain-containing protein [Patescibacteria group bacterium]